jgi:hypothetical protein
VAQRLNISQMHVSRLQHKALKRLKDLMSDVDEAAGSAQASSSAPSD